MAHASRFTFYALLLTLISACAAPPTTAAPAITQTAPLVTPTAKAAATARPPTPLPSPLPGPQTFTIALAAAPGALDPANAVDESALLVTRHLYDGLTAYAPGTTRVMPALATEWETTNAITWTFRLRADVQFSDGTPFTAPVAAQNFERWLNRKPAGAYLYWKQMFGGFAGETDETGQPLTQLVSINAPDAQTLILVLRQPNAALPATLAMPAFAMVNPAAFRTAAFGAPGAASAGTGPFMLIDWNAAGIVHLIRHPAYWGTPAAPDELVFKPIPDNTQRLMALQVGEIEGLARLNPQDYAAVRANPKLRVDFDPPLNVLYLGFNQAHTPWQDLNCRLAVAHALNTPAYAQTIFSADMLTATAILPPSARGETPAGNTYPYDPAQAQAYWQKCRDANKLNLPDSFTLYVPPIERPYLANPGPLGAAIQADLNSLGLKVAVASPEWKWWLSDVRAGRADLFLLGAIGVNGDPDSFLCPLFCGTDLAFNSDRSKKNTPLPPDPALAAQLLAARATTDAAQRQTLYAQALQRIAETAPAIPLAYRQTAWAYSASLRGNVPSPIDDVFFNLTLAP